MIDTSSTPQFRFEVFTRLTLRGRRHYFRIVAVGNGQIVAQSQGYANRADAVSICNRLKMHSHRSLIVVDIP